MFILAHLKKKLNEKTLEYTNYNKSSKKTYQFIQLVHNSYRDSILYLAVILKQSSKMFRINELTKNYTIKICNSHLYLCLIYEICFLKYH